MRLDFHDDDLFCGDDLQVLTGGRVELRPQAQDVMRYWANFVKNGYVPFYGLKMVMKFQKGCEAS